MSLFVELKRRRVIRVSAAYVIVCWLILQVADVVFPTIPLPDWSMRLLLAILVLGFPLVVLLAWVFQTSTSGAIERESIKIGPVILGALGFGALTVGAGLGFLWTSYYLHDEEPVQSRRPSIAVLPLIDMSPGRDKAYFSDGIHEEMISRLSEIRQFAVTSRTSVDRYRDNTDLSVREIAKELGVDFILEGSVRHSGDRVRITVQFIDAATDEHVWVRDFDKRLSMDELFDIQSEVSENIAALLRTQLTPGELQRLARVPTNSLAAYEAYLKGSYHYRRYNPQDLRIALDYWHESAELDPEFADAWSGLANGHMLAATTYGWMAPDEAIGYAKQYGAIALRMKPYSGSTISLIGDIAYWYDFDAQTAEAKYLEGIAVDPHHIGNRLSYGYLLSTQGRHDEARAQIDYWLEKEPRAAHVHANAAWRYFDARKYDDAIRHADIALSLDPGLMDAANVKAYALILAGRLDEAEPLIEGHFVLKPLWLYKTGRIDDARAYAEGVNDGTGRPGDLALMYAVIGDVDETIRQLDRAITERHRGALLINTWEIYDSVRADPRFQDLLRRVGFTNN